MTPPNFISPSIPMNIELCYAFTFVEIFTQISPWFHLMKKSLCVNIMWW